MKYDHYYMFSSINELWQPKRKLNVYTSLLKIFFSILQHFNSILTYHKIGFIFRFIFENRNK